MEEKAILYISLLIQRSIDAFFLLKEWQRQFEVVTLSPLLNERPAILPSHTSFHMIRVSGIT